MATKPQKPIPYRNTARHQIDLLAAFAKVELNLSRSEFLAITPRQFGYYVDAWEQREERNDRRVARVLVAIGSAAGNAGLREDDFLPRKRGEDDEDEDLLASFILITGSRPPNYGSS